jgi:hypothetical protein
MITRKMPIVRSATNLMVGLPGPVDYFEANGPRAAQALPHFLHRAPAAFHQVDSAGL